MKQISKMVEKDKYLVVVSVMEGKYALTVKWQMFSLHLFGQLV